MIIRPLLFESLDDALRLSTVAGWNQRLDDWQMLLRLAPAGAFAAFVDAHMVATAIGIDYGGFAWIAMMLVDPAYRGRGLGRRLLEAAMDAVPSTVPIRLDATPMGRRLYQQYGFEDEATLSRYARLTASAKATAVEKPRAPAVVRPLTDADLDVIIEHDRGTFGGTRGALLEWAFHDAPQYACVIRNDKGPIDYCLGRKGRLFDQIGPVVAGVDDAAHALVSAALAAAGDRQVIVDAFDSCRAFAAALHDDGFVAQRPLVRMCRPLDRDGLKAVPYRAQTRAPGAGGTAAVVGDGLQAVPTEFAILGPEFA